jgi:hypothetical protein
MPVMDAIGTNDRPPHRKWLHSTNYLVGVRAGIAPIRSIRSQNPLTADFDVASPRPRRDVQTRIIPQGRVKVVIVEPLPAMCMPL